MSAAKDVIEYDLMEEFHWLPEDIAKIPHRTMQKILLIRKQKNETKENQRRATQFKQSMGNQKSGKFYREV